MILPDHELHAWAQHNVDPFDPALINPASIDLRVGNEFVNLLNDNERFIVDEMWLHPGSAVLATTLEYIKMPPDCAGTIYLKSSMARKGLDHALAGWIDPGFEGQVTMELHAHRIFLVSAGMRVVQLVLTRCESPPVNTYRGRYQGQTGPTEAR